MIITFKHKALYAFFREGDASKLNQNNLNRLRIILARLDSAKDIRDMEFPGAHLHSLKGEFQNFWSVKVNANWRIIFRFEQGDAYDVGFIDYH
jgi:proteic killer suppression protein